MVHRKYKIEKEGEKKKVCIEEEKGLVVFG